jgi:hypothetical protein
MTTINDDPDWWSDDLKFCACGDPERIVELIRNYLSYVDEIMGADTHGSDWATWWKARREHWELDDDDLYLVIAYIADALGFTEHGGSIYGAWLTDKGRAEIEA